MNAGKCTTFLDIEFENSLDGCKKSTRPAAQFGATPVGNRHTAELANLWFDLTIVVTYLLGTYSIQDMHPFVSSCESLRVPEDSLTK